MPGRKQELYAKRREQILEGALQVFSARGFASATNRAIADAAGVQSPGLIYHYFPSKKDLLRAVIDQYAPPMRLLAHSDEFMALPPEQALAQFGQAIFDMVEDAKIGACMRVLIGESLRSPEVAGIFSEVGPTRVRLLLTSYLQRKMDEGLLRPVDPAIAARCFAGPLITYELMRRVLCLPDGPDVDPKCLVETMISVFLHGLKKVVS